MNTFIKRSGVGILILLIVGIGIFYYTKTPPYQDLSHFSKVFNRKKSFRVYLPEGYGDFTSKKYPVIYYFHGWGGRHYEDSANLAYDLIGKLVDKYQIILVMPNGRMEESNPRPYNMGYHEHMVYEAQMKDYFTELTGYIDSKYRTLDNRCGRGLMGFSMGGMMSFYLSGKYPDKIGAAVNMSGSTEFYIGTPRNYTFYPLKYTFTNLSDVPLRFHNSSHGELSGLNEEVNNGVVWEGNSTYEYWQFNGGHEIDKPGRTDSFEKALVFIVDYLQKCIPRKESWSHYDLYDNFEVWDYNVESDKNQPGFLFLSNVSKNGFGFYTNQWLPNGPTLGNVQTTVTTGPIYEPATIYFIKDYSRKDGEIHNRHLKSNINGRLQFEFDGEGHEIGIYQQGGGSKLTFVDYTVGENGKMLWEGENKLSLKIVNLGEAVEENEVIIVNVDSGDESVIFEPSSIKGIVDHNGNVNIPPIMVHCNKKPPKDGSPFGVKVHLKLQLDNTIFENVFSVPIFFDVPIFENLAIDDGRFIKDTIVGVGNGDGMVSPGEEIMIYADGRRTQLYYDDPYIIGEKLFDEALPAIWQTDGITFSSIIRISENCPKGHQLKLLAKSETKSNNPISRSVTWGRIYLVVGK
ncbi:alpha/beta hydrolase [Confluentibacter flavum]|uniref:Esterase n=1 Tax=Confluentibacter flavum TaxID=1909700 RepID=A0A2N3HHJ6_9FLAO|nr:alpha/beta hydrolase-fold protein [Confluentibacter flavum]PKQ44437.1 hypothetical protein CSW08_13580 [Confluentibacter flavum]